MVHKESLVYRLRKRAEIRRSIPDRKSVIEGQSDRIADLLEEAADALDDKQFRIDLLMQEYYPSEAEKLSKEIERQKEMMELSITLIKLLIGYIEKISSIWHYASSRVVVTKAHNIIKKLQEKS